MTFWSHSLSSKWAEDVTIASARDVRSDCPSIPLPVVQNGTTTRNRQGRRALILYNKVVRTVKSVFVSSEPAQSVHHRSRNQIPEPDFVRDIPESKPSSQFETIVVEADLEESSKSSRHSTKASVSDACSSYGDVVDLRFRYEVLMDQSRPHQWAPLAYLRWKLLPSIRNFFEPAFADPAVEVHYLRKEWKSERYLSLVACVFWVLNWILGTIFIPTPHVLADKIYYYGIGPILSIPLLIMCYKDVPRDHARFYQCFLCISAWSWSFYQIIFLYLCGFYGGSAPKLFTCGTKDFLTTFYYTSALQTVALFATNLKRAPALFGSVAFLILSSCLVIPSVESWVRNTINFIVFNAFLLYIHFRREILVRRLYLAQIRGDNQYKDLQKALKNQNETAESKYRLTSYVFHDEYIQFHTLQRLLSLCVQVRVPLNTALLAVQNIDASDAVSKEMELEFSALQGSLSQMSKVLNDVLDFNRMDSGKFESLCRPYPFHRVMCSMFYPLRLATEARQLQFETHLDMEIDDVSRRAMYEASGETSENIDKHLRDSPSGDHHFGMVVGDEIRLRQIVTNLTSNACKFTPAGGKITIRTRLIWPRNPPSTASEAVNTVDKEEVFHQEASPKINSSCSQINNDAEGTSEVGSIHKIVVRVEISDTGSGIKPDDMKDSKLFSAFNQTEQGRLQGGKGTGLGLALVRHIVKLSGGRLGVRSRVGKGSTFWFELPLGVGFDVLAAAEGLVVSHESTSSHDMSMPRVKEVFKPKHRDSMRSVHSIIEAVDAAMLRSAQRPPTAPRSTSAMQGLMDQGGSYELSLPRYDSHTSIPTRSIGDPSTGSENLNPEYLSTPNHPPQRVRLSECRRVTSPSIPQHRLPYSCARAPSPATSDTIVQVIHLSPDLPSPGPLHASELPPPSAIDSSYTPSSPSKSILFDKSQTDVLVVDDDPLTRKLMERMLSRMGCLVTTAANGDIALSILLGDRWHESSTASTLDTGDLISEEQESKDETKFTIVFLDNQMPVLTGLQVVARLREVGRSDFVVGVTGNALLADQKEYLSAGANYVLTKPVLEKSLRNMLGMAKEYCKMNIV